MISVKQAADVFKALGDENRIKILKLLENGELCACKLLEEMHFSQPTLSYHMKVLVDAGLVDVKKVGKWCHYTIREQSLAEISEYLVCLLKVRTN